MIPFALLTTFSALLLYFCRFAAKIGATRFELVTSCSQGRRANQAALRPALRSSVAC